jgi:hypothetical protein
LFALLLVLSRMPGSEALFPWVDFFRTALMIHVDQSVLIWFLSMAGQVGMLLSPGSRFGSSWPSRWRWPVPWASHSLRLWERERRR